MNTALRIKKRRQKNPKNFFQKKKENKNEENEYSVNECLGEEVDLNNITLIKRLLSFCLPWVVFPF